MSEVALRTVVDRVVQNLEQRGLPISVKSKRPIEPSGTAGLWCKVYAIESWRLEIWLDRWMHTEDPIFYYGFFSTRREEMNKFLSLSCDGLPTYEIKAGHEEYFEDDQVRLKQPIAAAVDNQMMVHHHRGRYWFGIYSTASEVVGAATSLFVTIMQEISPPSFREGACHQVTSDRPERNMEARRLCLKKYGFICRVCDFDFEDKYGSEIGSNFIHVHHIQPLSDGERDTDPEKDLIPVCPNCHVMLHRRSPPISPDELRSMIQRSAYSL